MQTDPDKLASGHRGPAHDNGEMNKKDPTQGIPDWLQPFTENLEDLKTHVLAHSSEREISDSEGDASKVETQKTEAHYTHFPKDRNCYICLRTKITRVLCRRRDEGSIPRVENFGVTADHKVLNEGSESRNNHRYSVVVQDLATQWIQSYPCKTKTSQEIQKNLMEFLEPTRRPQVIYTDKILEFGKSHEELSWNHNTSNTTHRKPKVIYTDKFLEFGKSGEELSWNHNTSNTTQIRNKWDCSKLWPFQCHSSRSTAWRTSWSRLWPSQCHSSWRSPSR